MRTRFSRSAPTLAALSLLALIAGLPVTQTGPQARATMAESRWTWPLDPVPALVHTFDPPVDRYGAGNRGVDLLGTEAQQVLAIGAGEITFARALAGRGVVVVSHGVLRSTYEPVTASVHEGQRVAAGEVIGLLQTSQSHCAPHVCLHLGLRRGDVYLDPLSVLGPGPVRLKPPTSADPGTHYSPDQAADNRAQPLQVSATVPSHAPSHRRTPGGEQRHPLFASVAASVGLAVACLLSAFVGHRQARG